MKNSTLSIINANTEEELVEKANESKEDYFATQPVQKIDGNWVMFCYSKSRGVKDKETMHGYGGSIPSPDKLENEKPKEEIKASKQQLYYLKQNKIPHEENITKQEAFKLIKEHKEKK